MYFYFNKHFSCIVYYSIVTHLAARTTTQSAVMPATNFVLGFVFLFIYDYLCMSHMKTSIIHYYL